MKIYLKTTPHVIKHLGRIVTHVAERKAADSVVNKGIATGKKVVGSSKTSPAASTSPTTNHIASTGNHVANKGFHWNIHSPFQLFWHFPWLIPILIGGVWYWLRWYWRKLDIKFNVRGLPLSPYKVYFHKIKSLMYKEDKTIVFSTNEFLYSKFPNFIWQQYWHIYTGLVVGDLLLLFFLPTDIFSIPFIIAIVFVIPLVFLGLYGSNHIKEIFRSRRRTLMQMFEVAASAFKYPPGAKLNPEGWVQIQQWGDPQNIDLSPEQQLDTPGPTYIMFPPSTPSESQGLRESFEKNFNGTVSATNTWEYEWTSSDNRVLGKPVPFISDKTVQYPFPDKNPWNIFVLGDAGSGKVASFDVSKTPHLLVAGTSGSGKQLALTSNIPTPSGWTTMGEIKVGDYVFDENGKPTKVLTVFDIDPNADLYRVQFSDGSYIDADAEHLWRTENQQSLSSRRNSKRKVVERRPLITEDGIANLTALRNKLSPHDEITIDEIISIAGLPYYSTWLTEIYNQVGHVGEIQIKIQQHYKEQLVRQHQKVTYYPAEEAWDSLGGYTGRHYTFLAERKEIFLTKKNHASPTDTISATDVMKIAGFANRRAVLQFFKSKGIKSIINRELVELQVPERISEKLSKPIRSYNAHALIDAILERSQKPAHDQRYKKTYSSVITTKDIASTLKFGTLKTHINHSIPVAKPLELPEADLPIPSYAYGVWLGDGTAVRGEFCGIDHEIAKLIKEDGFNDLVEITPKNRPIGTNKAFRFWFSPRLHTLLKDNGLIRRKFPTKERKYIPEAYLRASIEQRKMLLAGLLDTDGTVTRGGGAEFCNTNKNIAFGAYELALSLGHRATIREGRSKLNGKDYGPKWTVSFAPLESPFRLSRKTQTFNERAKNRNPEMLERRYITAVEKIPNAPARCIIVDSPSHMFLAGREMIPTHNSVTQRTLLMHALQSPDWRVALVDPKRVELAAYRNHKHVLRVATELDESLELISDVEKEMQTRYMKMQEESVNFFRNLKQPPPAFLLMIDETYALLAPEKIKNDEGKLRDEMHAQITLLIGSIARLGRAAGVHLMLATQRPDAAVLPGETKSNLDARIAQGRMDTTPSNMTLDSDRATRIPNIKGRAVLRTGQDYTEFQAFFLPEEQLPLVLEMSEALATRRIDISAFEPDTPEEDDEPEESGRFAWAKRINIPRPSIHINLPFGLSEKIGDFMENRRAIAEENDAQLQARIEYAKNGGKGGFNEVRGNGITRSRRGSQSPSEGDFEPNDDMDSEEFDVDSVANAARDRGLHGNDRTFITPRGTNSPSRHVRFDPEDSSDEFDDEHLELDSFDNDDRDIDEHDYRDAMDEDRPIRASLVNRFTRSPRPQRLPTVEDGDVERELPSDDDLDLPSHEEISVAEALNEINAIADTFASGEDLAKFDINDPNLQDLTFDLRKLRPITIEQVLAKADEIGAPISAHELLEALAYEAALEAAGMPTPEVSVPGLKEHLDPILDDLGYSKTREYSEPSQEPTTSSDFGPEGSRNYPKEPDEADYLVAPHDIPMLNDKMPSRDIPARPVAIAPHLQEDNEDDSTYIIEIPMLGNALPSSTPGIFSSTFIPSMPVRPKRISVPESDADRATEEMLRNQKALSAEAAAEQAWIPVPVYYNSDEPQEAPWMPKNIIEGPTGDSPFQNA